MPLCVGAHLGMDDLKHYAEQVRMEESNMGYNLAALK